MIGFLAVDDGVSVRRGLSCVDTRVRAGPLMAAAHLDQMNACVWDRGPAFKACVDTNVCLGLEHHRAGGSAGYAVAGRGGRKGPPPAVARLRAADRY